MSLFACVIPDEAKSLFIAEVAEKGRGERGEIVGGADLAGTVTVSCCSAC